MATHAFSRTPAKLSAAEAKQVRDKLVEEMVEDAKKFFTPMTPSQRKQAIEELRKAVE